MGVLWPGVHFDLSSSLSDDEFEPRNFSCPKSRIGPCLDIQADNAYVMASRGIHRCTLSRVRVIAA